MCTKATLGRNGQRLRAAKEAASLQMQTALPLGTSLEHVPRCTIPLLLQPMT